MWKDLPHKNYIYLSLGLIAASAFSILIFKNFLPPVVPLFYGRPVGQSQLVGFWGLLIAPAVALAITLINLFIAKHVQDNFLKRVLVISSFFISLLTAITFFRIIFLVGFFN
jgi:hypothetical protein